eukprot:207066-Prorocentrum_minimum.AAC.2
MELDEALLEASQEGPSQSGSPEHGRDVVTRYGNRFVTNKYDYSEENSLPGRWWILANNILE